MPGRQKVSRFTIFCGGRYLRRRAESRCGNQRKHFSVVQRRLMCWRSHLGVELWVAIRAVRVEAAVSGSSAVEGGE